jgi:quinol monooxygenase YgiN
MIVQLIPVSIVAGTQADFERTWKAHRHIFEEDPRCRRGEMLHCVEAANRYMLFAEWESVAAHEAFQQTPGRHRMLEALHPFLAAEGEINHFEAV